MEITPALESREPRARQKIVDGLGIEQAVTEAGAALTAARPSARVEGLVVERREQRSPARVEPVGRRVDHPRARLGMAEQRAAPAPRGIAPAHAREEVGVGREHVEGEPAARNEGGPHTPQEAQDITVGDEVLDAVEGDDREGESWREGDAPQVAAHEQRASLRRARQAAEARRGARQHRGRVVEAHDDVAVGEQWNHEPSRAAAEVEHGPASLAGEHPVEPHVVAAPAVLPVVERGVLEGLERSRDFVVAHDTLIYGEMTDAIVLLSGGIDSATALAMTRAAGRRCRALSFRYGQRHAVELAAATRVAAVLGACEHRIIDIDLRAVGGSALTSAIPVPKGRSEAEIGAGIPVTYVPARNTIFLAYAIAVAEVTGASEIVVGVNVLDSSGYPDCRPEWLAAMQEVARLGTKAGTEGRALTLRAPLIRMTKAEIIQTGVELGVDYGLTHSCYDPDASGAACGACDSCQLRRQGFETAGVSDPTRYVAAPSPSA